MGSEEYEMNDTIRKNVPVLLLLDQSGSMANEYGGARKIDKLNEGVSTFCNDLLEHERKSDRKYTLRILSFDGKCHEHRLSTTGGKFVPLEEAATRIPRIKNTKYSTAIGAAIAQGISDLQEEKENLANHDIPYKQPVLIVFTDGQQEFEDIEILRSSIENAREKIAAGWCIVVVGTGMADEYREMLSGMVTPSVNDGKVLECSTAVDIPQQLKLVSRSVSVLPLTARDVKKVLTSKMS